MGKENSLIVTNYDIRAFRNFKAGCASEEEQKHVWSYIRDVICGYDKKLFSTDPYITAYCNGKREVFIEIDMISESEVV